MWVYFSARAGPNLVVNGRCGKGVTGGCGYVAPLRRRDVVGPFCVRELGAWRSPPSFACRAVVCSSGASI